MPTRPRRTVEVPAIAHPGNYLDSLRSDKDRAAYCKGMVEEYRNRWFEGQAIEVAKVKHSNNPQYGKTSKEREATAKHRWATSSEADDLAGLENMWWRWAIMYQGSVLAGPERL